MPIYDLVCTNCGYEKDDIRFESYKDFSSAEKERACPSCYSKLDAKINTFNVRGKKNIKTTGGKIISKEPGLIIKLGITPCGKILPKGAGLAKVVTVRRDPENN